MVGGYRVDGLLGEGGMGTVYRATQLSLERVVALKVLTGELSDDAGFRERFRREGLRQAAIDHPHIVSVYEAGETDAGLFLAMRLVEGPTLKALVLEGAIDRRRTLLVLTQVADALDAAHAVGLIHRDVKPQNILIGARDHAYLADFGLTKGSDEDALLTEPGHFVGTIDYISPEQARGEGATARSDVYSLCCVLHECLTGEVPFPRPSEPSVLFAHLTVAPPKVSNRYPDLPGAIDAVIAKGMAKDAGERYPSAGALMLEARRAFAAVAPATSTDRTRMHRVEAVAAAPPAAPAAPAAAAPPAEETVGVVRPAPPEPTAAPAPRRRSPAPLIAALMVAAAAIGAVVGGSGSSGPTAPAPLANSASVGPLELSFPSGWQRLQVQPAVPGLTFANAVVLAPSAGASRLEAGTVAATGPTLLPASLLRLLPAPAPVGQPVRLGGGGLEALRYVGLRPRGLAGAVTLYVVPTSQGVLTLACRPGAAPAAAFDADCARVVASARVVGASAYPLGPNARFAAQVQAALARLAAARRVAESRLAGATTSGAQAGADRALAAAYAAAGRAVAATATNPLVAQAAAQIAAGLGAVARAYTSSATAAAANDKSGYAAAGRALTSAGADAARAIAGLRTLGYKLGG